MEKIQTGNFSALATKNNRGWIMGSFDGAPIKSDCFDLRWSSFKKGEKKDKPSKPDAETMTILINGKFKNTFFDNSGEVVQECIIEKQGDYIYFNKGITHTWEALKDSLVLALRWPSIKNKC